MELAEAFPWLAEGSAPRPVARPEGQVLNRGRRRGR